MIAGQPRKAKRPGDISRVRIVADRMTPQRYRLVFFDKPHAEPAAALMLHHTSDQAAETDARTLLFGSEHVAVEVWRGTSQIYIGHKAGARKN